jgi:hypothetical protein
MIGLLSEIVLEEEKYLDIPTSAQARAIFDEVARRMERQIMTGAWLPKLR